MNSLLPAKERAEIILRVDCVSVYISLLCICVVGEDLRMLVGNVTQDHVASFGSRPLSAAHISAPACSLLTGGKGWEGDNSSVWKHWTSRDKRGLERGSLS